MEARVDEEDTGVAQPLKGGLKAIPCIIANEVLEKVASFGLRPNMMIYLTVVYHLTPAAAATVTFIWGAASDFTPIFGAFLADSYLGKFLVIAVGSLVMIIGIVLLWLTALIPGAQPHACYQSNGNCMPTSSQLALLFSSLAVMAIGSGGVRPCSLAFGADQFAHGGKPRNERVLQTFFNWYYVSSGVSVVVAMTVIVYIQDHKGWKIGFGVPVGLMVVSAVVFLVGSAMYVKVKPDKSILAGLVQVAVVSLKNRHIILPSNSNDTWFHKEEGSELTVPSNKLRFLNKACVIRRPEEDLNPDGTAANPWALCTVQQVEDLKSIVRVLPIWSSGIMVAVVITQPFPVLQANTMDRHIGPHFQIPAASFVVFSVLTLTLWVAIYDRLLVPRLSKFTDRPRGLSLKQRMGIGLVLSYAATATSAIVEHARRARAIEERLVDHPEKIVNMSAMWLVPQYCLTGLAEAFSLIGQIEFYYSELPKRMASVAMSLLSLGLGVGNLVGSLILALTGKMSRKANGGVSWVDKNLSRGHYDYYYWTLAVLCAANFFYFLVCSEMYGEEGSGTIREEQRLMEAELVGNTKTSVSA